MSGESEVSRMDACNCPGGSKRDPEKHAPNCPVRTLPCRTLINPFDAPQPAGGGAVAWQSMDTAPRDGTVILLRFGQDGVSPGWWSLQVSPVQNEDGTWPRIDAFPWSFIDRNNGIPFVNAASDGMCGPSHWVPYDTTPPAAHVQQEAAYAERLARAMWQRHYRVDAPQWEPCTDLMGLLSQIDNMLSGLERPAGDVLGAVRELQRWDIGYTPFGASIQHKSNGTFVKLADVEAALREQGGG